MKTLILLTFLSVAAFVLAGYETATNTITTNTNAREHCRCRLRRQLDEQYKRHES